MRTKYGLFNLFTVILLFYASTAFGYGTPIHYHIKPDNSSNSSCPTPCLTLNEYVKQNTSYYSSISLFFMPGIHFLRANFSLELKENITLETPSTNTTIQCVGNSHFHFYRIRNLRITNLSFVSCENNGIEIGSSPYVDLTDITITNSSAGLGMRLYKSKVYFTQIKCIHNSGKILINVIWSIIHFLENCTFKGNTALTQQYVYGSFSAIHSDVYFIGNTTFSENTKHGVSGMAVLNCTLAIIGELHFLNNFASLPVLIVSSRVFVSGLMTFIGNSQTAPFGRKFLYRQVLIVIDSVFTHNGTLEFQNNVGPASFFNRCSVTVNGRITYNENYLETLALETDSAATLSFHNSTLNLTGDLEFSNNAAVIKGHAGMYFYQGSLSIWGKISFINNHGDMSAGLIINLTALSVQGSMQFDSNTAKNVIPAMVLLSAPYADINGSVTIINNIALSNSPIVMFAYSNITFSKAFTLTNNMGGLAILAQNSTCTFIGKTVIDKNICTLSTQSWLYSKINFMGETTISNNFANFTYGCGLGVISSTLRLNGSYIFLNNSSPKAYGGAMQAINSIIRFNGKGTFEHNTAKTGGAMDVDYSSRLVFEQGSEILFKQNVAMRGGAIHVQDLMSLPTCRTDTHIQFYIKRPACFFYILFQNSNVTLNFQDNTATKGGNALYGGRLDRCTPRTEENRSGLDIFLNVSYFNNTVLTSNQTTEISSEPFRLCFCENGKPNCSLIKPAISTRRGQSFSVSVTAFNQINVSITGLVRSYLISHFNDEKKTIGSEGILQQLESRCTKLFYRVWSRSYSEQLVMYAEGPCKDIGSAAHVFQVNFVECPKGFVLQFDTCVCDPRLVKYTNSCDVDTGTIHRQTNFWIGSAYDENGTYSGLILQPNCPFDYCKWPSNGVEPTIPDTQCNYNRSDILCGSCATNTSLILGNSECFHCSNFYLFLLIPLALVGILLVVSLFFLHLTVANGTLHGLVFYANIVTVNQAVFIPPNVFRGFSVFLAWLNLDLGIRTCFYNGMDQYAKIWLQFVFPIYLLAIVVAIIVGCRYLPRVSKLFGKNPVAVLATIILLSYTKILRNILAAFSYTTLEYPDKQVNVWLNDGNLIYAQGKHAILFSASLIALVIFFIPYTLLLVSAQFLKRNAFISSTSLFKRLNPFIDAYHAPYKVAHRYWTGLFLIIRCVLLVTFAVNALGEPSINLLAITTTCIGIGTISWIIGGIYSKRMLDFFEALFIFNLGMFAAATYHVKVAGGNQAAVANTSIGVAFITFLVIIIIQIYKRTSCVRKVCTRSCNKTNTQEEAEEMEVLGLAQPSNENVTYQIVPSPVITVSEMLDHTSELKEPLLESGDQIKL